MAEESQHAEPHPKGTLAMILLYLVMISILWIDAYLTLVEREAGGIVATNDGSAKAAGGETYVVTREGAIVKRLETGDPTDLTVVTGVVLQHLLDDREGAARTIRRALDLAADYAPPYRRKLEQAIRVIAELDRRGAKPDSIMLDNEARPDRVVVRMR